MGKRDKIDEALALFKQLKENAESGERISRLIELLILLALAFEAKRDTAQAMTKLDRALTLASK
jgi:hypothetical protein